MTQALRNPITLTIIAILLLILVGSTFAMVPETKQAVIVRFGEPQRILNRYRPGETFGTSGAGLAAKMPFLESIVWIDKRILSITMENQQVLSTDQLRLEVDAFARYEQRLREVRVACGDWTRVLGDSVTVKPDSEAVNILRRQYECYARVVSGQVEASQSGLPSRWLEPGSLELYRDTYLPYEILHWGGDLYDMFPGTCGQLAHAGVEFDAANAAFGEVAGDFAEADRRHSRLSQGARSSVLCLRVSLCCHNHAT